MNLHMEVRRSYVYVSQPEALLPRSVPYLSLGPLPINAHCADAEVYTDGGDEVLVVAVVRKAQQQAGLANT